MSEPRPVEAPDARPSGSARPRPAVVAAALLFAALALTTRFWALG